MASKRYPGSQLKSRLRLKHECTDHGRARNIAVLLVKYDLVGEVSHLRVRVRVTISVSFRVRVSFRIRIRARVRARVRGKLQSITMPTC